MSGESTYSGVATLTFRTAAAVPAEGVFLDFSGSTISSVVVNGASASLSDGGVWWRNHRLGLQARLLVAAAVNTVVVTYTNEYSRDGEVWSCTCLCVPGRRRERRVFLRARGCVAVSAYVCLRARMVAGSSSL
jgi:hypothetical protein